MNVLHVLSDEIDAPHPFFVSAPILPGLSPRSSMLRSLTMVLAITQTAGSWDPRLNHVLTLPYSVIIIIVVVMC